MASSGETRGPFIAATPLLLQFCLIRMTLNLKCLTGASRMPGASDGPLRRRAERRTQAEAVGLALRPPTSTIPCGSPLSASLFTVLQFFC